MFMFLRPQKVPTFVITITNMIMFFHIIKIIHNLRDRDLRIHGRNDFSQTKRLAKATLTLIPLFAVTNFVYQLFDILLHKKLSQLEQQIAR